MHIIRALKHAFLIAERESMNWTGRLTEHKVRPLVRGPGKSDPPAESEKKE
jgi:hypothetical protein